jgi:hypothetical protein
MTKFVFLAALAAIGAIVIAATCTIRFAAITIIDGNVWYSAEMEYKDGPNIINHKFAIGFIEGSTNPATKTVDGCLRSLQSGNSNFYSADSGLDEGDADTAVSRLVGPVTFGDTVNGDVNFSNIEATFNEDDEKVVVTGRLTNDDNDDLEDLRVCIVLRKDDGRITMVKVDNNNYDLNPDESVNFSVEVPATDDEDDAATVDLYVDGKNADEDDRVTDPQEDLDNDVDVCVDPTNTPTGPTATATNTNTPVPTITPGGPTVTNTATATQTPLPDAC